MRRLFLLIVLLLVIEQVHAQTDTLIIDTGTEIRTFLTANIDSITVYKWSANRVMTPLQTENVIGTPSKFTVDQNYPNPFNPITHLSCYIPKAGNIAVRIFDINGGLVKELFAGEKEQGQHVFVWDAKNSGGSHVASGMYLFSVRFNNQQLTKKIILLK